MKSVKIVRLLSHVIFMFTVFIIGMLAQNSLPMTLKTAATVLISISACYFSRNRFKNSLGVAIHLVVIALIFWLSETAFMLPFWAVLLFGIYGLLSFISMFFKNRTNYMERSSFANVIIVIVTVFLGTVIAEDKKIIIYALSFIYFLSYMFQNIIEHRGKQAEFDIAHSVGDSSKIYKKILLTSLCAVMMVAIAAGGVALVGKVSILENATEKVGGGILKFIEGSENDGEHEDVFSGNPGADGTAQVKEKPVKMNFEAYFAMVICILGFTSGCAVAVYLIVNKIKNRQKNTRTMTVEKVVKIADRNTEEIKKTVKPEDYSYRMAIRKIYRKAIRGKDRAKRRDLDCRTPFEQKEKRCQEGVGITDKFVEMYERARYSNTSLSKEDVLRMKAEGRERINEN